MGTVPIAYSVAKDELIIFGSMLDLNGLHIDPRNNLCVKSHQAHGAGTHTSAETEPWVLKMTARPEGRLATSLRQCMEWAKERFGDFKIN